MPTDGLGQAFRPFRLLPTSVRTASYAKIYNKVKSSMHLKLI